MSLLICSRHTSTIEWLTAHGLTGMIRSHVTIANLQDLTLGSLLIGNLPLTLAVEALNLGHRYVVVDLKMHPIDRGKELDVRDMHINLLELQLIWQSPEMIWKTDVIQCLLGVVTPDHPERQRFKIGLVARQPSDLCPYSS